MERPYHVITTLDITSRLQKLQLVILPLMQITPTAAANPVSLGSDDYFNLNTPSIINFSNGVLPGTSKYTSLYERRLDPPPQHIHRRRIDTKIDFERLAKWIRNCEKYHTHPIAHQNSGPLEHFHLIDVTQCCIVHATPELRYAALSYTWGPEQYLLTQKNYQALKEPQSLCQPGLNLNPVMTDAMVVCREIGIQFLWCDALCIVQDDLGEMMIQVENMDYIYSSAHITIIGAGTLTPDEGLSRVTRPTLNTNRYFKIGGKTHVLVEEVGKSLDRSKWATRGWTFQENLLSRRRLFFTDCDVVFQCGEDIISDSLCLIDGSDLILHRNLGDSRTIHLSSSYEAPPFRPDDYLLRIYYKISTILSHYVIRDLTHESDYLNAFQGIWNSAQPSLGRSQLGLPVNILARALLWNPSNGISYNSKVNFGMRRRLMFPSWSWSGWCFKGVFSFNNILSEIPLIHRRPNSTFGYGDPFFSPLVHIHGFRTDHELVPLLGKASIGEHIEGYDEGAAAEFNRYLGDNGITDGSLKGSLLPEPPSSLENRFVPTYNGIAIPYLTPPLKHMMAATKISRAFEPANSMPLQFDTPPPSPVINSLQLLLFWASIIRLRIAEKPCTLEEYQAFAQKKGSIFEPGSFVHSSEDYGSYVAFDADGSPLFCVALNIDWRSRQNDTLEFVLIGQTPYYDEQNEPRLCTMLIERVGDVCYRIAVLHPIKRQIWVHGRPRTETIVLG